MTVGQLNQDMTLKELMYWQAFYTLEAEDNRRKEMDMKAQANMQRAKNG